MERTKYINRLASEWDQHGRIIIAVDYDSTLYPWHTIDNQEDIDKVIKVVKDCQQVGAYVTIFTASHRDRYPEILEYCESIGIRVDSINENPVKLPYGHEGKIYYNINICDRSGMLEALNTLENAMYIQRASLAGKRLNNPGSTEF